MGPRIDVQTTKSLEGLLELELEWRRLERESGCVLPFFTWDWAVAWWTHLREATIAIRDSLAVLTFRDLNGRLVGVAPMMITTRPAVGPIRVRQLQFFGADPNITELRGVLSLSDWSGDVHRALLHHVLETAAEWDSVRLSGIPRDPAILALVERVFPLVQWGDDIPDYLLELPRSWEGLRGGLSRNIKESLRKCYNSLKRDGLGFELEVVTDRLESGSALADFFELHRARSRFEAMIPHRNVFDAPVSRRFLADVCQRFARHGALRIFFLRIGGQRTAARVGFVVGDSLYLYYSGFDPKFSRYSVMTTTLAEIIRYAITQGFATVNLSTGNDVSKTRWSPKEVVRAEASIVSLSRPAEMRHHLYQHAREAVAAARLWPLARFLARRS
jgi:CelD/BcsL family acetyltransferase involved in cellulose biosynthesis